jgi:hypothetical protein
LRGRDTWRNYEEKTEAKAVIYHKGWLDGGGGGLLSPRNKQYRQIVSHEISFSKSYPIS